MFGESDVPCVGRVRKRRSMAADLAGSEHLVDGVMDGLPPDAHLFRDGSERRALMLAAFVGEDAQAAEGRTS
jgi:hypothetical protein